MPTNKFTRSISQVYLTLVPVLTVAFGLGVGHISYKIYLPIWLINVVLMAIAAWMLGAHSIKTAGTDKKHIVACALFLIIPWMFISIFFGMGGPPYDSPATWVATATEQHTRYYFLFTCGLFIALGFAVLREKLKTTTGNFYSLLGITTILIAVPLFLISMTFWGFYLGELYRIMAASGLQKLPESELPIVSQVQNIHMIEVALMYIATAAYAQALKKAGWFKPAACNVYILISFIAFLLNPLPSSSPEPFSTASFIVSIPAIPFLMPYFMGINLLRRAGK